MCVRLSLVLQHTCSFRTAYCSTKVQHALIHKGGCLVNADTGIAEVEHILQGIPENRKWNYIKGLILWMYKEATPVCYMFCCPQ